MGLARRKTTISELRLDSAIATDANGTDGTSIHSDLADKIDAIYASGDAAMIDEVTRLLANVLADKNQDSLSALSDFFGLPGGARDPEAGASQLGLIPRARLFIDGNNSHRVEGWIAAYETSEPDSERRLLYENILLDFVHSRSEIGKLRSQLEQAHRLALDAKLKCQEVGGIFRNRTSPRLRMAYPVETSKRRNS